MQAHTLPSFVWSVSRPNASRIASPCESIDVCIVTCNNETKYSRCVKHTQRCLGVVSQQGVKRRVERPLGAMRDAPHVKRVSRCAYATRCRMALFVREICVCVRPLQLRTLMDDRSSQSLLDEAQRSAVFAALASPSQTCSAVLATQIQSMHNCLLWNDHFLAVNLPCSPVCKSQKTSGAAQHLPQILQPRFR